MNPVCVSTWFEPKKYFAEFMATAAKHGITPVNADPEPWPGKDWTEIPWWRKSDAQARFVRAHAAEYSHFLFCDSYDMLFAAGWDEILAKFEAYRSPIVFGTERYCWPDTSLTNLYPPCPWPTRFLNAGMWMATSDASLNMAELLADKAKERSQCDSGICVGIFLSQSMPIVLDNKCALLYCCNLDSMEHLEQVDGRVLAKETGERPCLFHGNGNADLRRILPWVL